MNKSILFGISILSVSIICSFSYQPIIADEQIDFKLDILYDTKITDNCFCSDGLGDKFCDILMRIGINIEELGKKVKPFGFVFFLLELIMIPIVILWNMFCD
jgi:hypothetical protein